MGNEIMTTTKGRTAVTSTSGTVKGWLESPQMQASLAGALAGWIDSATFTAQCYLAARDPNLAQCSPESLFAAFLSCAQMGLLPGKHHGFVALIPRKGVVDVMPQWQGFKHLMERQTGVRRVRAVLVHERDDFEVGADGAPRHRFDPLDDAREFTHPAKCAKGGTSGLRGGYAVIEYDDGREPEYHFVSRSKIERNRLCAQTQDVWQRWYPEQCLKTILRDVHARRVIPYDVELATRIGAADDADNRALGNDPKRGPVSVIDAPVVKEIEPPPAPPVTVEHSEPTPRVEAQTVTREPGEDDGDDGSAAAFERYQAEQRKAGA